MATNNATNTSNPITVAQGGTGNSSATAYAVQCGGTTSTGAHQSIASVGTSGQVLTSNGAGALPTFQNAASGGGFVFLTSTSPSSQSAATITSGFSSTYSNYYVVYNNVTPATTSATFYIEVTDDGGSTWKNSGYASAFFRWNGGSNGQQGSASYIQISETTQTSSSGPTNGYCFITNIGTTTLTSFNGMTTYYGVSGGGSAGGAYWGSAPASLTVNGIRFKMSTGNISGTFTLYGLSKS